MSRRWVDANLRQESAALSDSVTSVVITGLGPVTGVGVGVDALWSSLLASRTNVTSRTLTIDLGRTSDVPLVSLGGVDSAPGLEPHLAFLAEQDCEGHRDLAYALLAMELALGDAGLRYDHDDNTIGVVQAFEAPGAEWTVSKLFELMSGPPTTDGPPPVYELLAPCFYNSQPFVYVHLAGKALGLHGFSTSVHNACASGAFALEVAAERIRSGTAEAMIIVGGEAFDTGVRLEWFRRLGLYAADPIAMRPFDTQSGGFYVGEGGAAIVLESAASAARRGARTYAEYLGGSFTHQAWKQTIPDVRAARLHHRIGEVLSRCGRSPADIDFVVPHGAATQLSDGYEAASLRSALGEGDALAAAFKPYVGHMLAASGIVDLICGLLAVKYQTVPSTPNARADHTSLHVPLATEPTAHAIGTMLKLSTGFTGHDAASLFARVPDG